MRKIAITQRLVENESYKEQRECLDIRWGKVFKKLNFLPIVLPYDYDFKHYKFDGIILSGGNDLNSITPSVLNKKRDEFENNLITFAIKKDLPIFGVCRGMQIIANYFNSTFKKITGQINTIDTLQINQESRYYNSLKHLETINSYANYFIDNIGDQLIISATNQDNIIKMIEHKNKKIFASMGHIERNNPLQNSELNLLKGFFE